MLDPSDLEFKTENELVDIIIREYDRRVELKDKIRQSEILSACASDELDSVIFL